MARSACLSADLRCLGRLRQRLAERLDQEAVGVAAERERAGLAARADDAAGAGREGAQVLAVAAGGAGRELGREAGGEQQLQPERQRVGARGGVGVGVEQLELAAEQVVGGRVRLGRVEQPQHGVARLAGALERGAPLAQRRVARRRSPPPVTVHSSPRPSCSTRLTRNSGSSRPPKRDFVRRTPLAIAPTRPRSAVYRWRMRSASP